MGSKNKLSVLNVAYPFAPVSRDPVGGAEQIVAALDRRLVAAGHASTVVAQSGSEVEGSLVGVDLPRGNLDLETREKAWEIYRAVIARRLARGDIDVVHLHGVDFTNYFPDTRVPVVVTFHLPLAWYPPGAFELARSYQPVGVSRSQIEKVASNVGAASFAKCRLIENGVDLDRYRPTSSKGDYALVLGRICPEKGIESAIRAARLAQVRLLVAGALFPYPDHERYFHDVIQPLLDDERVFVGPVAGETKSELLARARCVLVPSRVDETSSLVAMEALASGTPVIAFRRGALGEIIQHGRTGFLVDDEAEMADCVAAASSLESAYCRADVETRYSVARMGERYLSLYTELAGDRARPSPRLDSSLDVELVRDDARPRELEPSWSLLARTAAPWLL